MTSFDLQRFVSAQDRDDIYLRALSELLHGKKATHWIWFVFPQIAGLGLSETAQYFSISSRDEARAYLQHDLLGPRLLEASEAVLANPERTLEEIFGELDAMKFRSSMSLFYRVDPSNEVFKLAIERYCHGEPDAATDQILGAAP
ncbi:MAG: DUF1810 domain-containing protein [Actinomycetota bacterium]